MHFHQKDPQTHLKSTTESQAIRQFYFYLIKIFQNLWESYGASTHQSLSFPVQGPTRRTSERLRRSAAKQSATWTVLRGGWGGGLSESCLPPASLRGPLYLCTRLCVSVTKNMRKNNSEPRRTCLKYKSLSLKTRWHGSPCSRFLLLCRK